MDASHHRDLSSLKTQLRHGLAPSTEQIIRGDITLQVIFSRLQNANNTNIVTSLTPCKLQNTLRRTNIMEERDNVPP